MIDADDLPVGWERVPLGDVASIEMGQSPEGSATNGTGEGLPLIGGAADLAPSGSIRASRFTSRPTKVCATGDIVLCIRATIGRPTVADRQYCLGRGVAGLRPKVVDRDYMIHFLRHSERQLDELGTGSTFRTVDKATLTSFSIPVPPLPEQRRIVARIEALQARSRAAREALDAVPGLVEQLRQSVLAAAFRGELTADWREQHPDAEPAEALLDRIRQERRRQWEANNPRKKYVEPERVNDVDLPGLPDGWAYARADEIVAPGTVISYGIVLPGDPLKEGVQYIRGQDIEDGCVLVDQLWKTSPEIAAKHERSSLLEGDVLLCIIRHLKVAIVPKGIDGANLTQGTVRLRPSDAITGPYLAAYLESPAAQGWMKERYFGMAMPRINVEDARAIPVPVAPINEQREITRRVAGYERHRARVLAEARAALAEADRLDQSVLAQAFRGELVEQDLADEPATALLERVRGLPEPTRRTNTRTRR